MPPTRFKRIRTISTEPHLFGRNSFPTEAFGGEIYKFFINENMKLKHDYCDF